MSRIQQLLTVYEIAISAPEWDVLADANFTGIAQFINTWEMTEDANTVSIQLQNANGEDVEEECYLRIKLCDGTGYTVSSDSEYTITVGTEVEEFIADKDLVIKSNSTGLITIQLTLSSTTTAAGTTTVTAEPVTGIIRIGPPSVSTRLGDYSNTLTVS